MEHEDDISMTPYAYYKLPFEEQLKQVHSRLLHDHGFYSHTKENRRLLLLAENHNWAILEQQLLRIGGNAISYAYDPHLNELVTRGIVFPGKSISDKGENSRCHGNVADLWVEKHEEGFQIVTGWALTKSDGIWRQHTFGRWNETTTIETTVKRSKYFGFVLSTDESIKFALANSDDFREKIEKECNSSKVPCTTTDKIV